MKNGILRNKIKRDKWQPIHYLSQNNSPTYTKQKENR